MGKKKTVKKKGVEYHHGPGKVRRVVGGGQKRRRRGTRIADYFSPPPFSIHVHILAHICTHMHTHMYTHTHTFPFLWYENCSLKSSRG